MDVGTWQSFMMMVRMFMMVRGCLRRRGAFEHMDFGARDAAAIHGLNLQAGVNIKRGNSLLQHLHRNACVHDCAKKHVAGDAGKAIKISDAHRDILS